jgi:hypothetical protein
MTVLSSGRFAGSGVGYVPKFHMDLWQARPETPHLALISLTSRGRRERMLTDGFTKNHAKNPERTKGMVNNNLRERKRILFVEEDKDNWEGGTRGEFAREWPSVLLKEVRSVRTPDAATEREN